MARNPVSHDGPKQYRFAESLSSQALISMITLLYPSPSVLPLPDVLSTTGSYQFLARSPSPPPGSPPTSTGPSPRQRSSFQSDGPRAGGEAKEQQHGETESQGRENSPHGHCSNPMASAAAVGWAQAEAGRASDAGEQDGDRAYERSHSSNSSRSSSSCCKGSSEEGEARAESSNEGAGKEARSDGEGGGEKWEDERGRSMQRDARQSNRASPRSLTAAIVAAGSGSGKWCFYEVLAAGYEAQPEEAEELLPLFAPLWSIPFCSQVFTLLLHRWVREEEKEGGREGGGGRDGVSGI